MRRSTTVGELYGHGRRESSKDRLIGFCRIRRQNIRYGFDFCLKQKNASTMCSLGRNVRYSSVAAEFVISITPHRASNSAGAKRCNVTPENDIIKIKIHASCEIEYFVETHLYTGCVSSLRIQVGDSPYNYSVAIRVNRVMLGSLCAETIKPVSDGDRIRQLCGRKSISLSSESCKSNSR